MSVHLPSLEPPVEGSCCPWCSEPLVIEGFCGACAEAALRQWPDETPLGLALGGYEEE